MYRLRVHTPLRPDILPHPAQSRHRRARSARLTSGPPERTDEPGAAVGSGVSVRPCRPPRRRVGTIGPVEVEPAIAELIGDVPFDPDALREKYREERDKRLRPDANEQYVEVTAEFSNYVDDPYVEPGFTREPLFDDVEVAIIGGGFGGLLMGARLREAGYRAASG